MFQYCDSNIGLLCIAPHLVIALPTLKLVHTAFQALLVIMSLSKGNALAIKKVQLIPYTMDLQTYNNGIFHRAVCLIR